MKSLDQEALKYALQRASKSPLQILFYLVVAFSPVALGFFALSQSVGYEMKEDPKTFPDLILFAVPFFYIFIFIEIMVCWWTGKLYFYRFNDSISSLRYILFFSDYFLTQYIFSQSMFERVLESFVSWLGILPYAYLYENYRFVTLEETWTVWILAFVSIEWGYYWAHRMCHEWNIPWTGHGCHHSSGNFLNSFSLLLNSLLLEEYNLTTALRQGAIQSYFG